MKKKELSGLNMKKFLPVCYEELEPYLLSELNNFRYDLILLPDNSKHEVIKAVFIDSVKRLNDIHENEAIGSIIDSVFVRATIDTDEREGLCEALYKMCEIVGLYEGNDIDHFIYEWREW